MILKKLQQNSSGLRQQSVSVLFPNFLQLSTLHANAAVAVDRNCINYAGNNKLLLLSYVSNAKYKHQCC